MEHSNVMWLLGAGRGSDIDLALVYDHLAYAEYKLENYKKAVQYTRDLLQNGKKWTWQQGTGSDRFACVFVVEPTHERALSNLAYFERLRTENPSEFVDKEDEEQRTTGSGRLGISETELYEATCREGKPLVRSGWAWPV